MKYATKISQFFSNQNALFIIPLYQRCYAWDKENCRRLFDDIIKINDKHLPSHFFGSIVTVQESMVEEDLLVIDGQQRITTISLIVLAIKNAVQNNALVCDRPDMLEKKSEIYLNASFRETYKLRSIEQDHIAYEKLFGNNNAEFVSDSGITSNYLYLYDRIVNSGMTAEELINAVERLVIIDLRLEQDDDPQLIFESLNSTGKDLTEADKVRNYLLMGLKKQQQEDLYHRYWSKIEKLTDGVPTMFFRDFLTMKLRKIGTLDNLYFDFKQYDIDGRFDREDLLKELLRYANIYHTITTGDNASPRIKKKLKQLASIGSTVGNPYYMSLFAHAENGQIDDNELYDVLDTTENYWARRIICGYPANSLAKIFATLHGDILRIYTQFEKVGKQPDASYADLLRFILLRKQGNAAFPTNEELTLAFETRKIYKLPIDYRYFLFERMENGNSKEGVMPVVEYMREGKFTIEHIMPQSLTPVWQNELGDDYAKIHEKYLHTFANLTLTGYNSNYGNRPFSEKKHGFTDNEGNHIVGFDGSSFTLSNYMKSCDNWTLTEITERQEQLLQKFLSLWPMITTSHIPLALETDDITISDEDTEVTGRTLVAFTYNGNRYEVTSWKDALVQVCHLLYLEDRASIIQLCQQQSWLHCEPADWKTPFADGCYVYTANDTKTKCNIMRYVFEKCGIDPESLILHLKPAAANRDE